MKKAIEIGQTSVYGGSMADALENYKHFDLVISLEKPRFKSRWKKFVWNYRTILGKTKWVQLEWRDFGVPSYDREFWGSIVDTIKKHELVLVHCQGGIGRTGTALAIINALGSGIEDSPVKDIRKKYIPNAIETMKQVVYVDTIVFGANEIV